jgi:ferredoxin
LLGKDAFKIRQNGQTLFVDQQALNPIIIDSALIEKVVNESYKGGGSIVSVNLISQKNDDNRAFELPSWQVRFDDDYGSEIYFSSKTGEYQGIRTDAWRVFDFFMMLHFMDYGQRGNFNHGLIIFAALVLVFFSMSGMLLLTSSFSRNDIFYFYQKLFQNKTVKVSVVEHSGKTKTLKLDVNARLMDALANHNIDLDSACGGGGVCGLCMVEVKGNGIADEDLSEHDYLTEQQLADGYRLACQLTVQNKMVIKLPQ